MYRNYKRKRINSEKKFNNRKIFVIKIHRLVNNKYFNYNNYIILLNY